MKWVVATDHGGFPLKDILIACLKGYGHEVVDLGVDAPEPRVDHPEKARQVAQEIFKGHADCGILLCGTGIGVSIQANRYKGIRAAVVHNEFTAKSAKEHNNANVLCMGGRVLEPEQAVVILQAFLKAEFLGGRYERRNAQLDEEQ